MSAARDPTSRLRAGLNPLLTSLGSYGPGNTPLSAISMTSHNAYSAVPTPVSAIQPYNPQEWIASPAPGSERNSQRHSLSGESTGSSLPPPPYSPPRSQPRPPSQMYEGSPAANTSAVRSTPPQSTQLRQSPDQQYPTGSQVFPPPPMGAGRGGSRDRRFGIPSLRRRDRESGDAITPPDTHPSGPAMYPAHIRMPATLSLQIPHAPPAEPGQIQQMAPAARRTQSTGSIGTPTSARSRSASQVRWDSSMPLPPPPPGPPPPGGRSQSLSRPSAGSDPIMSPPTRRPPPSGVTALGPVPPTPANWSEMEDGQPGPSTSSSANPPLAAEASGSEVNRTDSPPLEIQTQSSPPGSASLIRAGAVRGEKTLRERRGESRARGIHNSIDASLKNTPDREMSDILIPNPSQLSRRLTISRGTPRSGQSAMDAPRTDEDSSRNVTPRALASAPATSSNQSETPPFSPRPQKPYHMNQASGPIAPKALPTPPPQARSASSSQVRSASRSQTRLSIDPTKPGQLSPSFISKEAAVRQTADQFCRGTIERFQAFAFKEAAASDDAERVRLFAEFIVSESRVRRERYASSIGAMGSEVLDLTRDLFRPMTTRRASVTSQPSPAEFTPQSSEPSRSHRGSVGSVNKEEPRFARVVDRHGKACAEPSSSSLPPSPGMPGPSSSGGGGGQSWQQSSTNYMPSLSPILSMSVSDALDEQDSRGRPASRWWEVDSNGTPSMRMERTKRESKYMGVPKEGREALQWSDDPAGFNAVDVGNHDNEYPPEKVGWHEDGLLSGEAMPTPQAQSRSSLPSNHSAPSTPGPALLDVSRLVTLPPPYPRHHPAVNNNHPELAEIRAAVRAISDLTEVEAAKAKFASDSQKRRDDAAVESKKRVSSLRSNLQQEIAVGNMTYAEAAAIEEDSAVAERGAAKNMEKADFERFQQVVVAPLNDLLTARIAKATELFDELRSRLFSEAREPSPNNPQEEGDERPELLEKLTLLKWIFEAREVLHRAIYDLLSDRNDRYRDVVLMPYRLMGNAEKLTSAKAFFAEDAAKRAAAFAAESLQRAREFRDVVEENVSRGVEVQLSAFWDIAPPLKSLLDAVPADLRGFRIQVPVQEMLENPSYEHHPLQHLFSVLLHAEKSTYQFIESQTNLLCLLHEVKDSVAVARAKAAAAAARVARLEGAAAAQEGGAGGGDDDGEDPAVRRAREAESRALTEDLKEKVRVVQDQWNSALGDCISGVKERIGEWLLETGGWDESLEDGGVGGG